MSLSQIGHQIKHRAIPNDDFTTPELLAKVCIAIVDLEPFDRVLDAAVGSGNFYMNYPKYVVGDYCNASEDFLTCETEQDWIITNPPYSNLDAWFQKAISLCRKGFAFLLGLHNITPRRIEMANKAGFGLTKMHLCKVFKWYGISAFVVFEKNKPNIVSYDRMVWRVI